MSRTPAYIRPAGAFPAREVDGRRPAPPRGLERADAAGQRLFRELVVSRIAWRTVVEAGRLVAVDVLGVSLRAAGCDHPPPCDLHHCFNRLQMRAMTGNHGPRLPGIWMSEGQGIGGRVLETGVPLEVDDIGAFDGLAAELREVAVDEEGLHAMLCVPIGFGGTVHGVLHAALRRPGPFGEHATEMLMRLCGYAGAAVAAARDRARVEEIAALRERRRLARELHDDLGQMLFGIGVSARLALESGTSGRADLAGRLQRLEQQVVQATASFRQSVRALANPPTSAGRLAVVVRDEIESFRTRTGVDTHLVVLGDAVALAGDREDALVGVVREGLRNIERHSGASEVVLTLSFEPDRAAVVLQDDGVGLQRNGKGPGVGLSIRREEVERLGGSLRLAANDDVGATLRAWLPTGP
ncbi:MAG: histidine kinase [Thermoleophilia bacterium]